MHDTWTHTHARCVDIRAPTPARGSHESRLERQSLRPTTRPAPRASRSRHFVASIHCVDGDDARVCRAVSRDARGETRGCEQTTDVERVLGLRRRARGERGGNEREGDGGGGWETRPTGVNVRGARVEG